MQLLGIDYGEKRIGLAVSSEEGNLAFPLCVVENKRNVTEKIKSICEERKITKIILGESVTYKQEPNPIMADILSFRKVLEKETGIPIEMNNETLSTSEAMRIQGKNKKTDASAAAIILRSYLERINH